MPNTDESKQLVQKFSDRARKVTRVGKTFLVPHKFTEDGDVIGAENFDVKRDISRLTLIDFRFLSALQDSHWDFAKACKAIEQPEEKMRARYKRLRYFEFEESRAKALAALATPDLVASKNVENLYCDNLTDGQRDSLKELAKISGAYKPTTNINVNANILKMPDLTPEQAKAAREFFDTIATEEPHVA